MKFLIFEFEILIYIAEITTVAEKASSGPGKQKKTFLVWKIDRKFAKFLVTTITFFSPSY
jgi:hypothetical protein